MEVNKLYNEDCLNALAKIPDNSIDCIITDPPYGTKTTFRDGWMVGERSNVMPLVLPELFRILKPDGAFYCFTSFSKMSEWLLRFEQYFKLHNIIIWDKERHSGCYSSNAWQYTWEGIFFGTKNSRQVRKYMPDVIRSTQKGKKKAMEKPVDILQMLIEASTDKGMVILDPFMGTGSTIEACIRTERNYIGIEINKEFYQYTENRISSLCGGLFSNSFQAELSNEAGQ